MIYIKPQKKCKSIKCNYFTFINNNFKIHLFSQVPNTTSSSTPTLTVSRLGGFIFQTWWSHCEDNCLLLKTFTFLCSNPWKKAHFSTPPKAINTIRPGIIYFAYHLSLSDKHCTWHTADSNTGWSIKWISGYEYFLNLPYLSSLIGSNLPLLKTV